MINTRSRSSCQQSKDTFYEFQGSKYNIPDSELSEGFLAAEAILLFSVLYVRGILLTWIKLLTLWKGNSNREEGRRQRA